MTASTKLKEIARGHFYMATPKLVGIGAVVALSLLILGGAAGQLLVDMKRQSVIADVKERLEILAKGRADVISTWVEGMSMVGDHITRADVVRLFATETSLSDAIGADETSEVKLNKSLLSQKPYMEHMIREYVHQNNLVRAMMMTDKGRVFLSSIDGVELNDEEMQALGRVLENKEVVIMPLKASAGHLLLDIYKPIFALDEEGRDVHVVAVMANTFKVGNQLMEFTQLDELSIEGERIQIVQDTGRALEHVMAGEDAVVKPIVVSALDGTFFGDAAFAARQSAVDETEVFVASALAKKAPFIVVHEFEKESALSSLKEYSKTVYSNVLMVVAVLMVSLTAWLVYVIGARNRRRVVSQQQAMDALVRATEIRDPYLTGHSDRVAKTALKLGNAMNLSVSDRSALYYGAMLSGIGKTFIPQEILTKSKKLTKKEREVLESHVAHTITVLEDVDFEVPVAQTIEQMYERLDGSGYPNKLQGDEISRLSRILAVCDVYCALTHPRSYRKEMDPAKAFKQLEKDQALFDQDVVDVLKTVVGE